MRPPSSRVFDLALGVACALVLIGSADGRDSGADSSLDAIGTIEAAKSTSGPTLEMAYLGAPIAGDATLAPVDPATIYLEGLVASGRHWRLATERGPIHVWSPEGYDPTTAVTVVYVHGYHADADEAWSAHQLPQQFAMSGINALFVVPEAPRGKHDPVVWTSVSALLGVVAERLDTQLPAGQVATIGHSGAYRTVLQWLADPRLDTVVLLDAAYVEVLPYRTWVVGGRQRRLINVSIDTVRWSDRLHRTLPSTRVIEGFPREITDELRAARILYIRSDIKHWPLVTEGVALPAMLRTLHARRVLDTEPPLGLPGGPAMSALAERQPE